MADGGTLRNGRFVLGEPIGEGAQGRTFAGFDRRSMPGSNGAVAIKRFDVRGARSWKDVELAEREARVLQALSHPNLPAYIDHFEEDGGLYLVMEKIEGESLASIRKRGAVLGEVDVVRLLRDASRVLDYLHGRAPAVIHRDLKPGNVIRRPDGSFAFVDFGAVRDKLRPKGGSTVVGTFGYMAPEQLQGRALPASDVYAIGATALTMLTGREPEDLPHRGLSIDVRAVLGPQSRSLRSRLAGALEKMLEPDPDRRASRIAPLLADLDGDGDPWDAFAPRRLDRDAWRAQRRARRAERRAERSRRRSMGSRGAHPLLPWPGRLVFAILFSIGIVGVALATQVVVPLVLGVLSLFVAPRALIAASVSVRRAGHSAIDGMRLARQWLMDAQEDPREPGAQRVDVPSASPGVRGVRIETPDEMSADEEASADAPETESAGRERRR